MSLLARRRALIAQANKRGWDGRDCVAVGTNGYCYYSTDYGVSWARCPGNWTGVTHAHVARSKSVPANTGSPIWFTAGSYVYFARIGSTYTAYASVPAGPQVICGSGDGTIAFTCTNQGESWRTGYQVYIYKCTRTSETAITLATKGSFNTWDQVTPGKAACSVDGRYAVIGGAAGFTNGFQTTNYGESWGECMATQSFGNGVRDLDCTPSGDVFVATTPSGRPASVNYLGSWYMDGTGANYQGTSVARQPGLNGNYNYYYQDGGTLYRYSNWQGTTVALSAPTTLIQIRANGRGDKLIALGSNGYVYYSHNFGASWANSGLSGIKEISMTKYM